MPLVSVVVPTYNHAQFIGHALASVCAQTFTNWEAIVVNNFSTDDTESIVASMVDPRISLVSFANNGVIAASRNHGVGLARGEFVAFLDSDDCWYPHKLERCLKMMTLGYDLVCHGELWVRSESEGGASAKFCTARKRVPLLTRCCLMATAFPLPQSLCVAGYWKRFVVSMRVTR
ncbi:MAG: glycosyltransferase family 2 protein [Propionivibrio sp.]|nr:glycosyltransferase family 2 protein [Propionivibrio sp.]